MPRGLAVSHTKRGVSIRPFHVDLLTYREADSIIDEAAILDGSGIAWFLVEELIAWKTEHDETILWVLR